jgi:hypothetical protein
MLFSNSQHSKTFALLFLLMPLPALASLSVSVGEEEDLREKAKTLIAQDGFGGEAPIKQYIDPDDRDTDATWGPKPVPHDILMDDESVSLGRTMSQQKRSKKATPE